MNEGKAQAERSARDEAVLPRSGGALLMLLALLLSLGPAVGQGFGRFAYGLLLVPMRDDLGWSYAQAGLLNSANALGYLIGAILIGPAVARWGATPVFRASILATALSLLASGLLPAYAALLLWRALAGFAGGMAYVGGAAVLMQFDPLPASSFPLGIYYGGPGIGIVLSGVAVPLLLSPALGWGWQGAWVGLGLLALLLLVLIEPALRIAGRARRKAPAGQRPRERLFVLRDYRLLWPSLLAYSLFGLGYIGYMTFAVAFLRAMQVSPGMVQLFWIVLGLCAAAAGFIWGPIIRSCSPRIALFLIMVALAVGALLPVLALQLWSFALSALLFGSGFLAVISALTRQVRLVLPAARWTTFLGNATALFGLGQLLGPLATGLVADLRGGLALGLLGSSATLGLAALAVLFGPTPNATEK